MSETKHTPGPWIIGGIANCTDGHADAMAVWPEHLLKEKKRGSAICLVSAVEKATLEDEANAYLIAAAPELLQAAQALVNWYEANAPDVQGGPHAAYELAVAAVNKARASG